MPLLRSNIDLDTDDVFCSNCGWTGSMEETTEEFEPRGHDWVPVSNKCPKCDQVIWEQ